MRILLDTNVLISAFIADGTCADLLEHCARCHALVTSAFILAEFREKLTDKFGFSQREVREAVALLLSRMCVVAPKPLDARVCRDQDDDNVLAAALAGQCDCIVTGDRDLLDLAAFRGIPVVSPGDFWRLETAQPR
jgi:putative PIN family toxin of toxin-antitoxin system